MKAAGRGGSDPAPVQTDRALALAPPLQAWRIAAALCVVRAVNNVGWYGGPLLLAAMAADLGWSQAMVAGAFSVFVLVEGLSAPIVGALVDRFGTRRVSLSGILGVAVGLALASRANTPVEFYLVYGILVSFGATASGMIPLSVVVANRFVRWRGAALGLLASGIGLGMVFVVPVLQLLSTTAGWRVAWLTAALLVVGVALPLLAWFGHERPRLGSNYRAGGSAAPPSPHPAAVAWSGTPASAFSTPRFWLLVGASLFAGLSTQTLYYHQVGYLVQVGFGPALVASALGALGITAGLGRVFWGAASDRIGRELTYGLGILVLFAAIGILMVAGGTLVPWQPYAFTFAFGFGYSAATVLRSVIAADVFLGPSFATIHGCIIAASGVGAAIGTWLGGYSVDLSGTYAVMFTIVLAGAGLSWLCIWSLHLSRRLGGYPAQVQDLGLAATDTLRRR